MVRVRLNTFVLYKNGYISAVSSDGLGDEIVEAELVMSGLRGWGDSDVLVRYGDGYYLATEAKH